MSNRCDLTELLVEQCAHCRLPHAPILPEPSDDQFDEPAEKVGPWFPARWWGECSGCGERFEKYALIRGDGMGGWLAQCCVTR